MRRFIIIAALGVAAPAAAQPAAEQARLDCRGTLGAVAAELTGLRQFQPHSAYGDGYVSFQGKVSAGGVDGQIAYGGYTNAAFQGVIVSPRGSLPIAILDNTGGQMIIYEAGPSLGAPSILGQFVCASAVTSMRSVYFAAVALATLPAAAQEPPRLLVVPTTDVFLADQRRLEIDLFLLWRGPTAVPEAGSRATDEAAPALRQLLAGVSSYDLQGQSLRDLQGRLQAQLSERLSPAGIEIVALGIDGLGPQDAVAAAAMERALAEQRQEAVRYAAMLAEQEAAMKAGLARDMALIAAEAEQQAALILAEAEAAATQALTGIAAADQGAFAFFQSRHALVVADAASIAGDPRALDAWLAGCLAPLGSGAAKQAAAKDERLVFAVFSADGVAFTLSLALTRAGDHPDAEHLVELALAAVAVPYAAGLDARDLLRPDAAEHFATIGAEAGAFLEESETGVTLQSAQVLSVIAPQALGEVIAAAEAAQAQGDDRMASLYQAQQPTLTDARAVAADRIAAADTERLRRNAAAEGAAAAFQAWLPGWQAAPEIAARRLCLAALGLG